MRVFSQEVIFSTLLLQLRSEFELSWTEIEFICRLI